MNKFSLQSTRPVGILGFQGCIEPHEEILSHLKYETIRVRTANDLTLVDRLIIPGGESTTMLKLLRASGLWSELPKFAATHPVWGICAGAILIAREVVEPSQDSLNLIDIRAHRNYYGSQHQSFTARVEVPNLACNVEAHFIRAPVLQPLPVEVGKPALEILACLNDQPIFLAQGNILASAFHVELGTDTSIHEHFLAL